MEQVYPPSDYCCSEPINLKTYFDKFTKLILKSGLSEDADDDPLYQANAPISDEEKAALQDSCSMDLLDTPGEPEITEIPDSAVLYKAILPFSSNKISAQAKKLNVIKVQQEHEKLKCCSEFSKEENPYTNKFFMQKKCDEIGDEDLVAGCDFAVLIRVYDPFPLDKAKQQRDKLPPSHEILALGTNTLATLRNKIICKNELTISEEIHDPDEKPTLIEPIEKYPSGFFLINSTFYNATASANSPDYSRMIRNWAQTNDLGSFTVAPMEYVKLHDLTVRFGYPYVFQHEGQCEHIISFVDAWLLNENDALYAARYPYHVSISRFTSKYCCFCNVNVATWLVTESDRLPYAKTLFCDDCFRSYNFIGKEKVGTFKAYHYFDHVVNATNFYS